MTALSLTVSVCVGIVGALEAGRRVMVPAGRLTGAGTRPTTGIVAEAPVVEVVMVTKGWWRRGGRHWTFGDGIHAAGITVTLREIFMGHFLFFFK